MLSLHPEIKFNKFKSLPLFAFGAKNILAPFCFLLTFGNSVSYQNVLGLGGVLFRSLMEIKSGMMVKMLCHLYKLQMFLTI